MELQDNLGVEDVQAVGNVFKGIAGGIVARAKAKKAQKDSDAGNYWTLRPYLKTLIPIPQYIITQVSGQGITQKAILDLPAQAAGSSNAQIINDLKVLSGGGSLASMPIGGGVIESATPAATDTTTSMSNVKKYLPYIVISVIVLIALYFVWKKK